MTVYLLHIDPPLRHSKHYIGYARDEKQFGERVKRHKAGTGGALPREAIKAGSMIEVAHVWDGAPREFKRYVKRYGGATRYCPLCAKNTRPIPRVENCSVEESE